MPGSDESVRSPLGVALGEARDARKSGGLRAAVGTLDRAVALLVPGDAQNARSVAKEGVELGRALDERGAPLAALSEHLRALDLAPELAAAKEGIRRGVARYEEWRPPLASIAEESELLGGATGAFWIGRARKARVVAFDGGIRSESVSQAKKALEIAARGVSWLLLDMKELGYIGSSGLAAAVKVAESLEENAGGLVVFSLASSLSVVIDTLGLGKFLQVEPDLEHALAHPRGKRPGVSPRAVKPKGS